MKKIVIVEDEVHIRELLNEILEEIEGIEIFMADNGKDGIDIITSEIPDLVLLDIVMPEYSGYDILKNIKLQNNLKNTKVFLLTAKGQEGDRIKGIKLGADNYITKPFDPEFILQKACEALEIEQYF